MFVISVFSKFKVRIGFNGIFETDEEKTEKYYETLEELRIEKIAMQ